VKFLQVWVYGFASPSRMFEELQRKPAPFWGFQAILIRFVVTSLTTTLALYLLDHVPFWPSYLTFLRTENYYAALIFFFPMFGLAAWLLMSAIVHIVLRLTGKASDFDMILNIVGMGMLVPNAGRVVVGLDDAIAQLWEAIVESVGFKVMLGLRTSLAVVLALTINCVYILLGAMFAR
jgi:hypothetical protein